MIKIIGKVSVFVEWKQGNKTNPNPIMKASTSVEEYEFDHEKKERTENVMSRDYYEVTFGKKNFPIEKVSKLKENVAYIFDVVDGWITTRSYTRKDGTLGHAKGIFINDAKLISATPVDLKNKEKQLEKARKAKESDSPLSAKASSELPF